MTDKQKMKELSKCFRDVADAIDDALEREQAGQEVDADALAAKILVAMLKTQSLVE